MSLPETLSFILLDVRSLKRHSIDIVYDKKLLEYYILFLTETRVSQTDDLSATQSILEEYTLDHNISSFRYSSFVICYKSTILASCHQKNDEILFFQLFKQTYSGKVISVVLMYRDNIQKVFHYFMKS